jgi:hypothetical protein
VVQDAQGQAVRLLVGADVGGVQGRRTAVTQ